MIELGSRLELFVDDYLIERIKGDARLRPHQPTLMPLEPGCSRVCYTTILHEDGRYRRYQRTVRKSYKGEQYDGHPGELTEYLESTDGIRWKKPRLGLYEIDGSRRNNIVLIGTSTGSHNFTPFIDARPGTPAAEYYFSAANLRRARGPPRTSAHARGGSPVHQRPSR